MSESSSKSSQPLASKQEKDGAEKRGRGRPRKQPPVSPGTALVGSQVGVQTFASVYLFGLGRCPASWQVKTGLAGCGIIHIYMCSPHTWCPWCSRPRERSVAQGSAEPESERSSQE